MRKASEVLDSATQLEIEDLVCEYSLLHSRSSRGFDITGLEGQIFRLEFQRMVRLHPSTGRKSLYLSPHAGKIDG